jgi:hypothetical protein
MKTVLFMPGIIELRAWTQQMIENTREIVLHPVAPGRTRIEAE